MRNLIRLTRRVPLLALILIGAGLAGCTTATNDPTFALDHATAATATPTLVILPPSFGTPIGTGIVASTQTPIASAPVATAAPALPGDPPPLALVLPAGWRATYTSAQVLDQGQLVSINVAGYAGPVADSGTGFLYILWNYPSLVPVNPAAVPTSSGDIAQAEIYSDGLRFLQGTILDSGCTVGNYGHQTFMIGGQAASGQPFQSSQCPDGSPDVAGWYAGISVQGQKLLFYAYVQPVSAYNNGRVDLQHILDSIKFHVATPIGGATIPATALPSQPAISPVAPSLSAPLPTGTPVLG